MSNARQIRPSKGINRRGKLATEIHSSMVHTESVLEKDFVRLADFDPLVKEIYYQPIQIKFDYKGKERVYFPDYKLCMLNGSICIVEVKPKKFLKKEINELKFFIGQEYCKQKGWKFIVMTEDQIRPGHLQYNLKLLREARKSKVLISNCTIIISHLKMMDKVTLGEVQSNISLNTAVFNYTVYYLLYRHIIKTDLINTKISDQSIVYLNERVDENVEKQLFLL